MIKKKIILKEIIPKYHRNFSQRDNHNKENYIHHNKENNNTQNEQNDIIKIIWKIILKVLILKLKIKKIIILIIIDNYNIIQENYNNENNNKNDNLLYRLNNLRKFAELPFEKNKIKKSIK